MFKKDSALGISFADESDKLNDIKLLTMKEFLESYSYLTSNDYLATIKDLLLRKDFKIWESLILKKIIVLDIENDAKKLFIEYAKDYNELEMLVEKYVNERIGLASLYWEKTMKQFYDNAIQDFSN